MARRRKQKRAEDRGPAGFIVVDKPAGMTSHDVVDEARRWFGIRRVGHLGTLDPQATGVLPLAIRGATKLVPFFDGSEKRYIGTVRLGTTTDTLDAEGETLETFEGELPDEDTVRAVLPRFMGDIEQIPPMYSAVKLDGVPLHKLARRGEEVERPPKQVRVDELTLAEFQSPDFELTVACGAGTYVRTLAADIGAALGCGGHLASLRRMQSGPFDVAQAKPLAHFEQAAQDGKLDDQLIAPQDALGFPITELADEGARRILSGREVSPGTLHRLAPGARVSAVSVEGRMIGVLEMRPDRQLWPLRILPS